jgi:hypothetical protein
MDFKKWNGDVNWMDLDQIGVNGGRLRMRECIFSFLKIRENF